VLHGRPSNNSHPHAGPQAVVYSILKAPRGDHTESIVLGAALSDDKGQRIYMFYPVPCAYLVFFVGQSVNDLGVALLLSVVPLFKGTLTSYSASIRSLLGCSLCR
jgi:hypothetical protein